MTDTQMIRPVDILLVEDNKGDAELAAEALEDAKMKNNLFTVFDGEEALDFLYNRGNHENAPRPDMIILDLNLPKKDGQEVLEEVKSDPSLRRIPVVILTTSKAEEDILRTYDLHANCYITKPLEFNKFIDVVKSIEDFWMSIVVLPKDNKK